MSHVTVFEAVCFMNTVSQNEDFHTSLHFNKKGILKDLSNCKYSEKFEDWVMLNANTDFITNLRLENKMSLIEG